MNGFGSVLLDTTVVRCLARGAPRRSISVMESAKSDEVENACFVVLQSTTRWPTESRDCASAQAWYLSVAVTGLYLNMLVGVVKRP